MIENVHSKLMLGLSVVGTAFKADAEAAKIWPFILSGHYDLELKIVAFHQKYSIPETEADLDSQELVTFLENFKNRIRSIINMIIDRAEAEERVIQETAHRIARENVQAEFRANNKPHELGTVDEIAKKYSISKSEVRRRKAAGTLHELYPGS